MRSQLPFRLGIAPSLGAQTATSAVRPVVHVTVKFVLVPQTKVCGNPYKPGHIAADTAETLKETYRVSRAYPLSAGISVPLPLDRKFQSALTSCIDAGNYAVLLEFDWENPLLAVVDLIRDSSERLSGSSSSHRKLDRSQVSPYSPYLPSSPRAKAGTTTRVGPLWYSHQKANDFEPDRNVRWKLIMNDAWYGFYVKPMA